MITIHEWHSIKWEDRQKLYKEFKMNRSGTTSVVQNGAYTTVVDDGVREGDLGVFEGVTIEELRKRLSGEVTRAEAAVEEPAEEPVEEPKKKGLKKKTK